MTAKGICSSRLFPAKIENMKHKRIHRSNRENGNYENQGGKDKNSVPAVFLAVLAAVLFAGRPYLKQWRHMETGDRYLQELDYIQAIVEYTAAFEIKPDSQRAVEMLGQAYLQLPWISRRMDRGGN